MCTTHFSCTNRHQVNKIKMYKWHHDAANNNVTFWQNDVNVNKQNGNGMLTYVI